MATEQSLIFTAVPRDGATQGDTVGLSIVVSPRLRGGQRLGEFPDWLDWTGRLADAGLRLTLQAGTHSSELEVNTGLLRPKLWRELFGESTPVRSHRFDDHAARAGEGVLSHSLRAGLSLLKSVYRRASVDLALPDRYDGIRKHDLGNRGVLADLLDGVGVHWDEKSARERRAANRRRSLQERDRAGLTAVRGAAQLDAEGAYLAADVAQWDAARKNQVAERFASFSRMPTPAYATGKAPGDPNGPLLGDPDAALDFHQALSALGNYPALLRALGLVFDFEVPRAALSVTAGAAPLFLTVTGHSLALRTPTVMNPVRTAYFLLPVASGPYWLFGAAPRHGLGSGLLGIAALDPQHFGLAQVDVDGGLHKNIVLAESFAPPNGGSRPALAAHPEVYDPGATLPALRSGGFTLYADARAAAWIDSLQQSKALNGAFERGDPVELHSEDLVRGLRLDVWDDHSARWHSLHARSARYRIGGSEFDPVQEGFDPDLEEGWMESAATRPAPGTDAADAHFYLHEALARWSGWSLSAPRPDLSLPAAPQERDPVALEDKPLAPFDLEVRHRVLPGSLPSLRFGRHYRLRARLVNLAGLGAPLHDPLIDLLSAVFALPNGAQDGMAYRRFEPVPPPQVVVDDVAAVAGPGSTQTRLVIRTDNTADTADGTAADIDAASRYLLPPRTSVELGERLGMFDGANGKLQGDAATWQLIGERDAGELPQVTAPIAGQEKTFPLLAGDPPQTLPYLPDPLARGVALRDLPGGPSGTLARIDALTPAGPVAYVPLAAANPRAGSATLIGFGGEADWRLARGLRLSLAEPPDGAARVPDWAPDTRTLTVYLPKGQRTRVAASCYLEALDLPRMGVWSWLHEEIAERLAHNPRPPGLQPGAAVDETAHILQRVVEGGHWMLSPPILIELVHALRQPLGRPAFGALEVDHADTPDGLLTAPITGRTDPDELAVLTGWRRYGASDAFLLGSLRVHGAGTGRIDVLAEWDDPTDDPAQDLLAAPGPSSHGDDVQPPQRLVRHSAMVDRIDLATLREDYLLAADATPPDPDQVFAKGYGRAVGYYDPEHDQIAFVRAGDRALPGARYRQLEFHRDAAPRHRLGDTRHHRVRYRAVAVSRDADCFPEPAEGAPGFTRESAALEVSIPASARPRAPDIAYVVPSFAWQRQTDTGVKRSLRFGGGLRVYLNRPWYSSGAGELLGVSLWSGYPAPDNDQRKRLKSYFTQWGMDPIWDTRGLGGVPQIGHFPDRVAEASGVSLAAPDVENLQVDVAAFATRFDPERKLWFADLTLEHGDTYMPFVRLALVRYQPEALPDARISRAVLADFAQLTPDRAVLVHADPSRARTLRVQVSGIVPRGPRVTIQDARKWRPPHALPPTLFRVQVQARIPGVDSDLAWQPVPATVASVDVQREPLTGNEDLALWQGQVRFAAAITPDRYRLLIEEYELIRAEGPATGADPGRLVFAETVALDAALAGVYETV